MLDPNTSDDFLEIRPFPIFSDATINAKVNELLTNLPSDAKAAVVAHADLQGAKMAVMFRIGDSWSFGGYLAKPYSGKLDAGAEIRFVR